MEGLTKASEVLAVVSGMAVSLAAILALLSTIFKPIRKAIAWLFNRLSDSKEKSEQLFSRIDKVESTLSKKVDDVRSELTSKIQEVSDNNDRNEKNRLRWEILDFANSCKNGRRHTQDEYKHIIEAHDDYETFLEKTGDKNGFLDAEYEYILKLYAERQEKNDFL